MGWGLNPKIIASHSIHFSLTGGMLTVVSSELWSFDGSMGWPNARFKITFSDGSEVIAKVSINAAYHEYTESRVPLPERVFSGYHRFYFDYYDEYIHIDSGEFTSPFVPFWTDWYYLTSDMYFDDGYPY